MPGSTTSSSSEQHKAKVTDSSATNGIFVRPVAVAGLFRPPDEATNKPALPEKRRFSALAGDLRPCSSSDNGNLSDDFARRRQSWNAKVKDVPFGQALLRKTPRNSNASSSLPMKQDPAINGSPLVDASLSDKNLHEISHGKSTETSSSTSNNLEYKSSSIVVQPPVLKDKLINNDISQKTPGECDNRTAKELGPIKQPVKSQNHNSGETNESVNSKISTGFNLNPPSKRVSVLNKSVDKTSIQETVLNKSVNADNSKQPKKVYGLIKRDSKAESSNNAENTSIINIEPKSQNESSNVEHLLLRNEVPEPIPSKAEILPEPTPVNSNDSKKMKVYGLSKKSVIKDTKDKEIDTSKQITADVTSDQSAPDIIKKAHEAKFLDRKSDIISKSFNIDINKTRENDNLNKTTENIALSSKSFNLKRVQPVYDKKSEITRKFSSSDIDKTRGSDTVKSAENISLPSKSFDSKKVKPAPDVVKKTHETKTESSTTDVVKTQGSDIVNKAKENISFSSKSFDSKRVKPAPDVVKKTHETKTESSTTDVVKTQGSDIVNKTTENISLPSKSFDSKKVKPAPDVVKKTHEIKTESSTTDVVKTQGSDIVNKTKENISFSSKSFDSKRVKPAPDVAKKTHETKTESSRTDVIKTQGSVIVNKTTENISLPCKSFDSKKVKPAPDVAKKTHETKTESHSTDFDKTRESDIVSKTTENISVPSKSFDSEKDETTKINEFQKAQSPPKEFRTVRRTSDVIAAKIQNIFSNISTSDRPPLLLSKKGKNIEKESTNSNSSSVKIINKTTAIKNSEATYKEDGNNQAINLNKIETKSVVDEKSDNIEIRNSSKILSKSPLVSEQELKINNKRFDVDSKKEEGKYKQQPQTTADRSDLKKENKLASESKDVLQPCKSGGAMTTCELAELQLKTANSEKECSVTAVPSKAQNKNTLNIGGKMPIKQDGNNLDCTTSHKAPNQDDRKSPDSTVSFRTSKQASNKGLKLKAESSICPGSEVKVSSSSSCRNDITTDLKNNHKTIETSASIKESNTSRSSLVSQTSDRTCTNEQTKLVKSTFCNGLSQSQIKVEKLVRNSVGGSTQVSKIEVAQITPSTIPGIVPTVNVLFRTKSPQSSATKEENRKKVVVETYASSSPVTSAVINVSNVSKNLPEPSNVNESFKEALKTVESVQKSLNSPGLPTKHSIINLKKEELVSVTLGSNDNATPELKMPPNISKVTEKCTVANNNKTESSQPCIKQSVKTDVLNTETSNTMSSNLESAAKSLVYQISSKPENNDVPDIKCEFGAKGHKTNISVRNSAEMGRSSSLDSKTNVVDLVDWNKKFQRTEPEPPRVPVRRRSARESMPPSLPIRSRFGSLKRIDDSPRYVPRSPSQSSLPQRYSYTEMLSKVCSMGVLPLVEPSMSKSYSSSSSQVSELWSELSEEQSTATHASEMLEAETTERMRLEKEVQELQNRCSQVQLRSDKMEMEMMEARVYRTPELNGDLSEDDDPESNSSLYKQKYERAVRDMEIMKRRIQQQHEEEIEQKAMLKKASDKRLAEALEDVEEERQVANQWKRKSQKLGSELQDLRLMLEEQMARNGELEKKQRRFDAELSAAQEEIKKERLLREKFTREKEQALHEKYSLEQYLQSAKLDSDTLHEKITQLNRELDELTLSSKGEEEVTQLKRAKQELERKNRDQEEELEELAAQVSMLEQAKLRLEMSLEKVRQEHRREASVREEEIEEIRASFSKKIKNLEAQLEAEQDERHQLVKQKHELERRLYEIADQPPPQDPEIERRLRRDLKRTKALLRDAQSMLEHTRDGQSGKTVIRQLKNQLEDSEFAKAAAVKARQAVETELQDCQIQLEEATRTKNEVESRCLQLSREKSAIQTQLEEAEEEMAEVMKKYKAVVAQMSIDQRTLTEQNQQIADLETERQMLKDQLSEVSHKFEHLAGQSEDTHKVHRLDGKVRDLESKLELELTTRSRLEHQISRLKEQNDRAREECDALRNKELQAQEGVRRLQRQIRDLREDYSALQQKEAEAYRKQHELEMALENSETDLQVTKNDLRLACQRIQDLQSALEDDLDSGTDVPDDSGSDSDESFEMAMMRNYSVTPTQRCDSVASNYSYASEGIRSRTSSFTQELSAFSRMMLKRTSLDFLG